LVANVECGISCNTLLWASNGAYENISEYVRDLIRRDKERTEREAFDRLKAELTLACAAPDDAYQPLTAADVIARNRV
jgi:antitoxin ParD1/3/4